MDQQEQDLEQHDDQARQRILEVLRCVARAVVRHIASGSQPPGHRDLSSFRTHSEGAAQSSETIRGHRDRLLPR
jgi:hypothetical protein